MSPVPSRWMKLVNRQTNVTDDSRKRLFETALINIRNPVSRDAEPIPSLPLVVCRVASFPSNLGSPGFSVRTVSAGRAVYTIRTAEPSRQHRPNPAQSLQQKGDPTNLNHGTMAKTPGKGAGSHVAPQTNTMSLKFCDHKSVCGCEERIPADKTLCDRCAQGKC
ncbi:hypothetical protein CPLU01_09807 [Colletotrichum plurivorum]|uniref:Uncharacterized protein n=1 Tax=Colletotrichum plurivorum TaxID=2175906 RepID=A0A8H6NAF8_9PEZI|nr:hypothetical protein CPLU01_09807 [Colletotrichum plurivorum]